MTRRPHRSLRPMRPATSSLVEPCGQHRLRHATRPSQCCPQTSSCRSCHSLRLPNHWRVLPDRRPHRWQRDFPTDSHPHCQCKTRGHPAANRRRKRPCLPFEPAPQTSAECRYPPEHMPSSSNPSSRTPRPVSLRHTHTPRQSESKPPPRWPHVRRSSSQTCLAHS